MQTRSLKRIKAAQNVTQIFFSFEQLLEYPRLRVVCEFKMHTATGQRKICYTNTYRSGLWPDTKLQYEGKAVTQVQALPLSFPLHESTREWTNSNDTVFLAFFRAWAKQSLSFIRAVQPTSTALTKQTECFRCKEGFSAVFIFFGLTLHCSLLLAKLTSMLKLKENSLKVFLSEQVRLNGLDRKTISILKGQSKIPCHLKKQLKKLICYSRLIFL